MKLLLMSVEGALARSPSEPTRRLVQDLFCGLEAHQTTCRNCGAIRGEPQPWSEQALNVEGLATLDASLAALLEEEELKGANAYDCHTAECRGELREAKRAMVLHTAPAVLSLHLKRFVYDTRTGARKKVTSQYAFPRRLDLRHALRPEPGDELAEGAQYDLAAIMFHKGNSSTTGHYGACDCAGQQQGLAVLTCDLPPPPPVFSHARAAAGDGAVVAVQRRARGSPGRAPDGRDGSAPAWRAQGQVQGGRQGWGGRQGG